MAQAPWWLGMVAIAPTLIDDHKASHDIEIDPDGRTRWAGVTVPTIIFSGDQTFPGLPEATDARRCSIAARDAKILAGRTTVPRRRPSCRNSTKYLVVYFLLGDQPTALYCWPRWWTRTDVNRLTTSCRVVGRCALNSPDRADEEPQPG